MKRCIKCGNPLNDEDNFCPKCGSQTPTKETVSREIPDEKPIQEQVTSMKIPGKRLFILRFLLFPLCMFLGFSCLTITLSAINAHDETINIVRLILAILATSVSTIELSLNIYFMIFYHKYRSLSNPSIKVSGIIFLVLNLITLSCGILGLVL